MTSLVVRVLSWEHESETVQMTSTSVSCLQHKQRQTMRPN